MFDILFGSLVLLVFLVIGTFALKPKNLPPGPFGLPFVGILPFINQAPHIKFQEFYKKYGNISSFYVGQMLVVLLSDYELIKEAFVKQGDIFSSRPDSFQFRVDPEDIGIVTTDGAVFKQFKSFIVSTLKDFGAVRASFEAIVKENAEHFVKYVHTIEGKSVDILESLGLSIAQTYCHIILGKRMDVEDPIFKELIALCYREQRCYHNGVRIFLPWTRKIPILSKYIGEDEIREVKKGIFRILDEIVKENEADYVEGSKKNFIHSWLTEVETRKLKNPNEELFTRRTLLHNVDIVFSAGYETTTTTIRWAFLFLLKYPRVQAKVIEELDEVIGQDRLPSLDDCSHLPYTMAMILEVHRCATIGPLGVPHRNKEATSLSGYHIPKSSYIYANAFAVHTNEKLFPEPLSFKPERFIDESGKFHKSEYVIPFSIGKRQCPGEPMANTEIFLYLMYLLQNFRIEKAPGSEILETTRSEALSAVPPDFKMVFVKRNANKTDN